MAVEKACCHEEQRVKGHADERAPEPAGPLAIAWIAAIERASR